MFEPLSERPRAADRRSDGQTGRGSVAAMIVDNPAPRPLPSPVLIGLTAAVLAVLGAVVVFWVGPSTVKPLYVLSGALVGTLVGLTGVGGGSLMTPLLILAFGFHPASAVGTDLLFASATKAVGTGVHAAGRTIDWRIVRRMALGSVPATLLTVAVSRVVHLDGANAAHLVSVALGAALVLTAVSLFFRDRLARFAQRAGAERGPAPTAALTVALGAVLGVLITLTSVGAGALGVTLLVFLYPRLPIARIVGSDIVHAVPLTFIAGMAHWWSGNVDLILLASLLLGSVPGIIVGSILTPRLPERALRPILATVLILVGVKLAL